MGENTFIRELKWLLPFFILHLSSGVNNNFTTILIKYYNDVVKDPEEAEDSVRDAVIGVIQEIPPIIFAVAGGFLQQRFGPKKLLISSAVPSILSWLVMALWSQSFIAILSSRLLAGLANGLLTGNTYLAEVASNTNRSSLKMIELVFKNIGGILIFGAMITLSHIHTVSWVFLVFPILGFFGMFMSKESPIFEERNLEGNERKNLSPLKVLISSPTVYKPLILISLLHCLLQCSGSQFIKKFMIQILDSNSSQNSASTLTENYIENDDLHPVVPFTNRTKPPVENTIKDYDLNYVLPLVIVSVRLVVIVLMSFLVKKLRVRLLYFFSLFTTLILLVSLALVSDPSLIGLTLSDTTSKWIKTVIICLHVFVIQLGVNTLPQLLVITLFPTSCKAAMMGIMRAIVSVINVVFVFLFKTLEYSVTFYLMAAVLLVSSPLLYLYVPEIRNIGSDMAAEFFLPSQTIFYFLPPRPTRRQRAIQRWISVVKKMSAYQASIKRQVSQHSEVEEYSMKYPKVKFAEDIAELDGIVVGTDELFKKQNKERVHFISNILSQTNPLIALPSKQRVLIGKGPIKFQNDITGFGSDVMKTGSIFLFNDLLIVATRVISNRRYIWEVCFKHRELKTEESEESITLSDLNGKSLNISFENAELASLWNKFITFPYVDLTDFSQTNAGYQEDMS